MAGREQEHCRSFSGPESEVIMTLLGNEWAEKFIKIWDRSNDYIYPAGYDRRSFRTKLTEIQYLPNAVKKLDDMVNLVANDFTYEKYFTQKDNAFADNPVVADLIALEIDQDNEEVLEWLKNILYGDNNTGLITHAMLKGMLRSHRSKAFKWVGDLLLAAKLQEGLRQSIAECMDEGSKEGFLYMLKLILEHNLVRFSSVARALDTWTGLGISAQKPAVLNKCLATAYRCLTEEGYAAKCLASPEALLIFMGPWAEAFEEVTATENSLKNLLAQPEKYKRMVGLFFLRQVKFPVFQHRLAAQQMADPDLEVKCWALGNLFSDADRISLLPENKGILTKYKHLNDLPGSEELFVRLKEMLDHFPPKGMVYAESIFPWCQLRIAPDDILVKMLLTITEETPEETIDLMLDYREKMDPQTRVEFVKAWLSTPKTGKQKTTLIELMADRSSSVRIAAYNAVEKLPLTPDDYRIIEGLLQYKSGDLRKNALAVLLRQSPEALLASIKHLAETKNEDKHLAALDMIALVENNAQYAKIQPECRRLAVPLTETSQRTRVLAAKIVNPKPEDYTLANGLGLYDPTKRIVLPELKCPRGFSVKDILSSNFEELKKILLAFSSLIKQNKDYEYKAEEWNGSLTEVVLGGEFSMKTLKKHRPGRPLTLEDYPLPEVWRGAAQEYGLTTPRLLELLFYFELKQFPSQARKQEWYRELADKLFSLNDQEIDAIFKDLPYTPHIRSIFLALLNEYDREQVFSACRDMTAYIFQETPPQLWAEDSEKPKKQGSSGRRTSCLVDAKELAFWPRNLRLSIYDDQSFREGFLLRYALYEASDYNSRASLQLADFEKAFGLGLIDENELYAELCGRPLSAENLSGLTNSQRHCYKDLVTCTKLNEIGQRVINRIVGVELKRGDMTTEVSHLAAKIDRCRGAEFFVDILVGAEKDTYVRGHYFAIANSTKKEIFSHLLKCCHPAEGEDENTLRALLSGVKVREEQLLDAAMYAPQWLGIVENYLEWPGLKSACWYFHAHVNETLTPEKEAMVARYSPVSPQDFQNGAFDLAWFKEAYSLLGERRFQSVYNSAKYIAGGGLHKRAQLFADAVSGKIDIQQAERIIREKRNKDYVLCYGLIPLNDLKTEALRRYEFLQAFRKESKQFGAQRRESEGKAVSIALENLARNAGFRDVTRFTWAMETELIKSAAQYLKPESLGDIELQIEIDEIGRAAVVAVKDGKMLKDVPSKFKNHEYVKEIKAVQKLLKDQYSRARESLEKAMETEDEFSVGELLNLGQNPVISPLLQNLVFKSDGRLGYFKDMALIDVNGQSHGLEPPDICLIAHPVHLYAGGNWPAFQKDIYDRRMVQPFKQVFRELYRPNCDELAARTISHRYDGQQIQPKKTVALLKGRGWTASYEQGLQKVYYKENIVAELLAMADWFSPAEIEAPTIEGVIFQNRKTGKGIPITDIPEVIFSEIMRDLDLVVSVAHIGGVDPEASLSTIEMRTVIVREMLRLFKLNNVELKGSHAFIQGTLGRYNVHLGSAVVHKMAGGAVYILPIHSQHRGRIFLPFIDDDPKTAEIISKIVFLAEDQKIKDPNVLLQLAE